MVTAPTQILYEKYKRYFYFQNLMVKLYSCILLSSEICTPKWTSQAWTNKNAGTNLVLI